MPTPSCASSLAVKAGEQVALVCDAHSEMSMVYALPGVTESLGAEYTILVMPTRSTSRKNELTPPIEKALEAADCLIGLNPACRRNGDFEKEKKARGYGDLPAHPAAGRSHRR